MAPSKAHRYCVSLIRAGLLRQDKRGVCGIGPLCSQLGHSQDEREHARRLRPRAAQARARDRRNRVS
jgi:DNA-binding IclR family transcriptional regulator